MNMTKTLGLLGEKLGHSFSPLIHGYLGNYDYSLFEIDPGNLDSFMTEKRFDGINVTIPYKQSVLPYCKDLSEEARIIGSVNTIIKSEDGALHGHNTDFYGFRVMLEKGGIDPKDKKVLVLGDGGSARTVRAVLNMLGAREIVTVSRKGDNNYSNIMLHFDSEVIINTTPVGMYPENGRSLLSLAGFKHLTGVADLIYNPIRTRLLLDAERIGVPSVNGLVMLVAQAEMASRLFMGDSSGEERVPIDFAYTSLLKKTQNIALIGMPGCGKSTIGRELAKMMERPYVDCDDLIANAAGKTIPRIFQEDGQAVFRRMETENLADVSRSSGVVIATGGGVVTQEENYDLLRQNSFIVYLKRNLSELVTDGRPLSETSGVQALAEQRLPIYEAWSDLVIHVDASPEQTAARIFDAFTGNFAK